ncbi:MAG TPA: plastocyanin/azurin family copper-binding protein [Gaiellaceae bacterium]|nr:plastocyanin/azurin family copper-binding protein [Gaiellaceae bacterium]
MARIRIGLLVLAAACAVGAFAAMAGAGNTARRATTVTVTAGKPSEFRFTLSKKSAVHGAVTFKVTNKGALPHDFKIAGKKTKLLSPGQSQSLKITFKKAGKYPYLCTVTGHAAAGMKGTFKVT